MSLYGCSVTRILTICVRERLDESRPVLARRIAGRNDRSMAKACLGLMDYLTSAGDGKSPHESST